MIVPTLARITLAVLGSTWGAGILLIAFAGQLHRPPHRQPSLAVFLTQCRDLLAAPHLVFAYARYALRDVTGAIRDRQHRIAG